MRTHEQIRVFKGTAQVHAKGQNIRLTGERELALDGGGKLKAQTFDTRQYEDDFFRWSALRSGYLSEATVDQARLYIGPGPAWYGPGWYGAGWYWDPWFGVWTFIPADGIFYSPFGWGFYSPIFVYRSPFFFMVTMATNLIISMNSIIRMDTALSRPEVFVEEGSVALSPAGAAASSCVRRLTLEDEVIAMRVCGASN